MESIGQILKAARERHGKSIADVATATRMTSTFVEAIENNRLGKFLAPVYERGFIKLYAESVNLDPLPVLEKFDLICSGKRASFSAISSAEQTGKEVKRAKKIKPVTSGARPKSGVEARFVKAVSGSGFDISLLKPSFSRLVGLLAGRWQTINRVFPKHVWSSRFSLPPGISMRKFLPGRRLLISVGFVLLIIAALFAWNLANRGIPAMTDECRWLAEPEEPYLALEKGSALSGR